MANKCDTQILQVIARQFARHLAVYRVIAEGRRVLLEVPARAAMRLCPCGDPRLRGAADEPADQMSHSAFAAGTIWLAIHLGRMAGEPVEAQNNMAGASVRGRGEGHRAPPGLQLN